MVPTLFPLLFAMPGPIFPTAQESVSDRLAGWIRENVPALLARHDEPGLAVAVVQDGRLTLCEGFGLADRGAERPVTADTLFNVGSISKTLTAWVVMERVEAGDFGLDDPLDDLLGAWPLHQEGGPDRHAVTVAGLLSHTAGVGLPSVSGHELGGAQPSLREELAASVTLVGPAGERHAYSGGGYGLLQLLIEERGGRPFAEQARKRVFEPLGMADSRFGAPADRARLATAYSVRVGEAPGGEPVPERAYTFSAAAGLTTSARDLGRFVAAHMPGPESEPVGRGVLRPETVGLMGRPWMPAEHYGLGYELPPPLGPHPVLMHTGTNLGWKAHVMVLPSLGVGIAVLSNTDRGETLHAVMGRFRDEVVAAFAPR